MSNVYVHIIRINVEDIDLIGANSSRALLTISEKICTLSFTSEQSSILDQSLLAKQLFQLASKKIVGFF